MRKVCCSVMGCMVMTGLCAVGWGQPAPAGPGGGPPGAQPNPERWKVYNYLRNLPELRLAFSVVPVVGVTFGFTDDQNKQIAQAVDAANIGGQWQAFGQKMQDQNLKDEDRQKLRAEHEAKIKASQEELRAKFDAVLTPEQKTLFQKIAEASKAAEKALRDSLDQFLTPEQKKQMEEAAQRFGGRPARPAGQ